MSANKEKVERSVVTKRICKDAKKADAGFADAMRTSRADSKRFDVRNFVVDAEGKILRPMIAHVGMRADDPVPLAFSLRSLETPFNCQVVSAGNKFKSQRQRGYKVIELDKEKRTFVVVMALSYKKTKRNEHGEQDKHWHISKIFVEHTGREIQRLPFVYQWDLGPEDNNLEVVGEDAGAGDE
jgi:hypothetical protein